MEANTTAASASSIRLSICIPTYNFADFIGQTLDSILPNLTDRVEVVILDGGSTDHTAEVVAERQRMTPAIRYLKQPVRGGIDRDIATAVSQSLGDYCWLFSADDLMRQGAVARLLQAFESGHDIYLCEHTLCQFDMTPIERYQIFRTIDQPETFDLAKPEHKARYFREARTSEAFFSFLSGPVFRRDIWNRAEPLPDSFYQTCWALAGRLLKLIPEGLTIHYLGEPLLFKRSGNDSFMDRGIVNRFRITVEGFWHIAETLFGADAMETRHIRRVTRNEWRFSAVLAMKLQTVQSPPEERALLARMVALHYRNAGLVNGFKYGLFLLPPHLIRLCMVAMGLPRRIKRRFLHTLGFRQW